MRLISWNVNGIRAAIKKGLPDFVEEVGADVLCFQETKAESDQVETEWATDLGYEQIWNSAEKRGYSGTAIWSKIPIGNWTSGIGEAEHDHEGRVLTATYDDFHLVNVYTPNAQRGLARIEYREAWDKAFLDYVSELNKTKPVIFCGDLNCAHKEIDLANPKANKNNAGFSPTERAGVDRIFEAGFVDTFREFDKGPDNYTWWTYRSNARARNIGWRIDYFFVSKDFWKTGRVKGASILPDVHGSDHCPVQLDLKD